MKAAPAMVYGGCGGPSLISLGLSAPQLAYRPPSSNPQDPDDAGKAALSSWKARPRVCDTRAHPALASSLFPHSLSTW